MSNIKQVSLISNLYACWNWKFIQIVTPDKKNVTFKVPKANRIRRAEDT